MADPVLDLGGKLGYGHSLSGEKKDRIISEPALADRLFRNQSFPASFKGLIAAVDRIKDQNAPEGRSLFSA